MPAFDSHQLLDDHEGPFQSRHTRFGPAANFFQLRILTALFFFFFLSLSLLKNLLLFHFVCCYGLNIGVPLPNSYVEILPPNVMILRGGALGRWSGHEDGALVNGISALMKETWKNSLALFPPCEDTMGRQKFVTQKRILTRTQLFWPLISDFQPLELWEINFCCLEATQSMAICYSSLKWLRNILSKKIFRILLKLRACGWLSTAYCQQLGRLLPWQVVRGTTPGCPKSSLLTSCEWEDNDNIRKWPTGVRTLKELLTEHLSSNAQSWEAISQLRFVVWMVVMKQANVDIVYYGKCNCQNSKNQGWYTVMNCILKFIHKSLLIL